MDRLEAKLKLCEPAAMKILVVEWIISMEGDILKGLKLFSLLNKQGAS
jgi:hypothetical protein